jgi:hypothetical protein
MTVSRIGIRIAALSIAAMCLARSASAEPAFLSRQYTRCTACHTSPTGGGLLSSYGRALSGHELSLTGTRPASGDQETPTHGEEAFLWGILGNALGPVQLGIEVRPSHLSTTVGDQTVTRDLVMNADLIGAVAAHGWTFYGEVGREPTNPEPKIASYEHWAGYTSAGGLGFRVGRFTPAFGVRFADHTSFNRSYLGFDKYDQVYGLELSRSTSRSLLQLTLSPGLAESFTGDSENQSFNLTSRWQIDLGSSTTVAASGFYRNASATQGRQGAGGAAFGFAPLRRLTVWSEGDVKGEERSGGTTFIFVNETSFEALRGLWLKVSPQLRTEAGVQPQIMRWAFSAVLLPRTHWNVNASYYHDKPSSVTSAIETFLVQLHCYL